MSVDIETRRAQWRESSRTWRQKHPRASRAAVQRYRDKNPTFTAFLRARLVVRRYIERRNANREPLA